MLLLFLVREMNFNLLIGKQQEYTNPNAEIEESILNEFKKNFNDKLEIQHNCKDYTTLANETGDVVRLKYGQNSKWVKILIVNRDKYFDDPLFSEETKKNQIMWKSTINTIEDLDKYIEIIKDTLEKIK